MEYCSFEDAFPEIGPSSTGCKGQTASEAARKEERKKAKRCKGPPLTFLDLDPDRPAVQRPPEVPPLNKATGLREQRPVDGQPAEPFTDVSGPGDGSTVPYDLRDQYQPNDAGQIARNTFPRVSGPNKQPKPRCARPSYFGASGDSEEGFQGFMGTFGKSAPYTDVIGDDTNYRMYPDFMSAFQRVTGTEAAAGKSLAPIPSVSNEWKPLTPAGARTAFFDELPPPGGQYPRGTKVIPNEDPELIQKKFDLLFARLDEMQSRRGENTQTEILLFVMSGLFVIFGMDIISRNAARIRLM
jgi:hypothetical protein